MGKLHQEQPNHHWQIQTFPHWLDSWIYSSLLLSVPTTTYWSKWFLRNWIFSKGLIIEHYTHLWESSLLNLHSTTLLFLASLDLDVSEILCELPSLWISFGAAYLRKLYAKLFLILNLRTKCCILLVKT